MLRIDNGTEYCNAEFQQYLATEGINHETSAPYKPEQNGLAERTNRTLVEKARCIMAHARFYIQYWAEVVNTAVYLKNKSRSQVIDGKIPEGKHSLIALSHWGISAFLAAYPMFMFLRSKERSLILLPLRASLLGTRTRLKNTSSMILFENGLG